MSVRVDKNTIVRGVEAMLAVVLAILLIKLALAFSFMGETSIAPTIEAPLSKIEAKTRIDSEILSTFDVFYRNRTSEQPLVIPESAPETTLNLKVFGMRADLDGDTSSAIIQTPDMKQATYYLNDEIISGVHLKHVDIDYVLLDRNGTIERLSRQGRTEDETNMSASTTKSGTLSAMSFKANDMVNSLRFYPQREGRDVVGYRVLARKGQDLETFGFRQNDIVVSINGEDMTQGRVNLPNLLKNFKLSRYASIQVLRDGSPVTIEVNLQ